MSDDFDCKLRLDQIQDGMRVGLNASPEDCAAICSRLGLLSLDRLESHAVLNRAGEKVTAAGRVLASLTQACVATGEPVAAAIDEPFLIHFLPEPTGDSRLEEIELEEADCDTVFHDGLTIDLGSAVADTLALNLDPYPRSAGAEAALKEAGVMSEGEAGPFGALAKLLKSDDS